MLAPHPVLQQMRRPQAVHLLDWSSTEQTRLGEYLILASCGVVSAAAVLLVDFDLRLPGHAILRAVFPMALGFACVPRRGAGTVMGLFAAGTWAILATMSRHSGFDMKGLGATTSLLCTGPLLDVVLRRTREGWRLYAAFVVAGLSANLAAMAVQFVAKLAGWGGGGGRSLTAWLAVALITYPACGAIAGLVSALTWFRWRKPSGRDSPRREPGFAQK